MTVPSDPNLTRQPSTLDPQVEIVDDAPRAMGHNEDLAGEVDEAREEFKNAVDAEAETPEVGPRAPGDHAGESDDSDEGDGPPDGSIDEVLAWVGDDHDRAQQALDAENAKSSPRSSLVSKLESI